VRLEPKAESDYACTSGNAVESLTVSSKTKILFLPGLFLGACVMEKTGGKMEIWPGECHVHAGITPEIVVKRLEEHPDAEFLIHPECGCGTQFMYFSEKGTSNMIQSTFVPRRA